jgi:hypothetical protein
MKKFMYSAIFVILIAFTFSLFYCGGGTEDPNGTTTTTGTSGTTGTDDTECNPDIPDKSDAVLVLPDASVPADLPQNKAAMMFDGAKVQNTGSVDITLTQSQQLNIVFWTPPQGVTDPSTATELIGSINITLRNLVNMGISTPGIPGCSELDISTMKLWYDPYFRGNSTFNLIPYVDAALPGAAEIVYEDNIDNNWKVFEDFSWTSSGADKVYIYANSQSNIQDLMMMLFRSNLEEDTTVVDALNEPITEITDWFTILEDVPNMENYFISSFQSQSRDNYIDVKDLCSTTLSDKSPFMEHYLPTGTYLIRVQKSFQADSLEIGNYALLVTKNGSQVPVLGAAQTLGDTTYTTTAAIPSEQTLTPETPATFAYTDETHVHWFKFDITND